MAISTYVIDHLHGRPAEGVNVQLERRTDATWSRLAAGHTDADGEVTDWGTEPLLRPKPGLYRLVYDAAGYFATLGMMAFYPEVVVVFAVFDPDEPYEIPLLLGPYGYATFRGHRRQATTMPAGQAADGRMGR